MTTAPFLDRHPGPYTIEPYAFGQLAIRNAHGRVIAALPAVRSDSTLPRGPQLDARAADALALAAIPDLVATLRDIRAHIDGALIELHRVNPSDLRDGLRAWGESIDSALSNFGG